MFRASAVRKYATKSVVNLRKRVLSTGESAKKPAEEESSIFNLIPLKYMVVLVPTAILGSLAMSLHIEPWRDYLEEKYPRFIKFTREYIDFEDALRLVENARILSVETEAARVVQALVTFDNGNSVIIEGVQGNIPYPDFEAGLASTLSSGQVNTSTGKIVSIEFLDRTSTSDDDNGIENRSNMEQLLATTSASPSVPVSSKGCPLNMNSGSSSAGAGGGGGGGGGGAGNNATSQTSYFSFDNISRSLWDESLDISVPPPDCIVTSSNKTVVSSINGGVVTMSRALAETDLNHYIYGGKYNHFVQYMLSGLLRYQEHGALDTKSLRYKPGKLPKSAPNGATSDAARQRLNAERSVRQCTEEISRLEHELREGSQRNMDDIAADIAKVKARRTDLQRKHLNWFYYF